MSGWGCARRSAIGILVVGCAALTWTGALAERKRPPEVVGSEALGGQDRYLAHVSTDKPVYRGGEKVYVRAVILHAADHTPAARAQAAVVRILGPKGETVATAQAAVEDGVCGFAWEVPDGQAGGEYVARVTAPALGIPPAERKFDVRAYRAPRIKTQIVFLRDGYGPGDTVTATLRAARAEGGAPARARVKIAARVDGREVYGSTGAIDELGSLTVEFKLPGAIERGEGTLAFVIEDGGVVETATKTIPILLQTVDLALYPEGGVLVAGLPCRVYLEAKTPAGKPADISGSVVDSAGLKVASFRTEHEGRGRFALTPRLGERYHLRIQEPAGIGGAFALPAVEASGATIQTTRDSYGKGEPVVVQVRSSRKGPLTVTLSRREAEVAALEIRGSRNDGEAFAGAVTLTPPAGADGVLIATVWDADRAPLAERLIYREPAAAVRVKVEADRKRHVPGGRVNLTVHTTDPAGRPVGAVVGLTVTDDSVLELIEKREQAPRLPVMVLLEPEVRELADARVYLDPSSAKAPRALDLLLGTQGWRRFAFVRVEEFLREHGDGARRALAMRLAEAPSQAGGRGGVWRKAGALDEVDAAARMPMPVMRPQAALPAAAPVPVAARPVRAGEEEPLGRDRRDDRQGDDPDRAVQGRLELALGDALEKKRDKELGFAKVLERSSELIPHVAVREYAHRARPDRRADDRVDFTETLFWHAGLRTDAATGTAAVSFDLSDAVTGFRVAADAVTARGALGEGTALVESVQPFYAEPKLPLEVTAGDRILLPVGVVNGTTERLAADALRITAAQGIAASPQTPFALGGEARVRRIVELAVGDATGTADLVVDAAAGPYRDRVTRPLRVVPRGFPVEVGQGGMLAPDGTLSFAVTIPASRVPGSVRSSITVHPTPLANLTEAFERLIQEPYGCFEQTTSTTYPLVMAQQYFLSHQGVDPKIVERSRALLDKGYQRLTGFECKQKGYEWFGEDPGHEALTAYGLLEFVDMAKVRGVDPAMLERTRAWLLGARDGKGGFRRERRALHTWVAEKETSNAYITWALLTAGTPAASLSREVEGVTRAALASKDSYLVAVAANVAAQAGDKATARALANRLAGLQTRDGYVDGAVTSIVGSGGVALQVETTAFAITAWLEDPAQAGAVERGMRWLTEICKGGRYGSTQSTVLALRALLAYDAARSRPKAPGSVHLFVDGAPAGGAVAFDGQTSGAIKLVDIAEMLEPGAHTIELRMAGGSAMPCTFALTYSDEKPDSSPACALGLAVKLSVDRVDEGGVVEANVTLVNREDDRTVPTPVAIVGLPGGLEVRHDQLKELVKAGRIAAYEVLGRDLVLYWRALEPGQRIAVPVSLVAAIPGEYTGPASRAYLYYTDEQKVWVDPLRVAIAPAR